MLHWCGSWQFEDPKKVARFYWLRSGEGNVFTGVCHSVYGGCLAICPDREGVSAQGGVSADTHPPREGHGRGRYASYWNVSLLKQESIVSKQCAVTLVRKLLSNIWIRFHLSCIPISDQQLLSSWIRRLALLGLTKTKCFDLRWLPIYWCSK